LNIVLQDRQPSGFDVVKQLGDGGFAHTGTYQGGLGRRALMLLLFMTGPELSIAFVVVTF
jgi:hypothetical protein